MMTVSAVSFHLFPKAEAASLEAREEGRLVTCEVEQLYAQKRKRLTSLLRGFLQSS